MKKGDTWMLVLTVVGVMVAVAAWQWPKSSAETSSDRSLPSSVDSSVEPTDFTTTDASPMADPKASPRPVEPTSHRIFLADQKIVGEEFSPSAQPIKINGRAYPNSITEEFVVEHISHDFAEASFNLDRRCENFAATIGLDDSNSYVGPGYFSVRGDGQVLASRVVNFGESKHINISVKGVLRLSLRLTPPPDRDIGYYNQQAGWGDAAVTCSSALSSGAED